MARSFRCHCGGIPECKLCGGTGRYSQEFGELGYQPFRCPTCEGKRTVPDPTGLGEPEPCPTCQGLGRVDPMNPAAPTGLWDTLVKFFFGA